MVRSIDLWCLMSILQPLVIVIWQLERWYTLFYIELLFDNMLFSEYVVTIFGHFFRTRGHRNLFENQRDQLSEDRRLWKFCCFSVGVRVRGNWFESACSIGFNLVKSLSSTLPIQDKHKTSFSHVKRSAMVSLKADTSFVFALCDCIQFVLPLVLFKRVPNWKLWFSDELFTKLKVSSLART